MKLFTFQAQQKTLEDLAGEKSFPRGLHPGVKLVWLLLFLSETVGCRRFDLGGILFLAAVPILAAALWGVPFSLLLRRSLPALPLSLMAGAANLFLEREILFLAGPLPVTKGAVSLLVLLFKTLLSISGVFLFIAVTPLSQLTGLLIRLKLPGAFVVQLSLTFRYLHVLGEEAGGMVRAYLLRSPGEKGIKMKDMGPFLGQLLLRSYDRAGRVYTAMKCRGYGAQSLTLTPAPPLSAADAGRGVLGILALIAPLVLKRFFA